MSCQAYSHDYVIQLGRAATITYLCALLFLMLFRKIEKPNKRKHFIDIFFLSYIEIILNFVCYRNIYCIFVISKKRFTRTLTNTFFEPSKIHTFGNSSSFEKQDIKKKERKKSKNRDQRCEEMLQKSFDAFEYRFYHAFF